MSTLVALFAVPNANAWKVGLNISLISIICTVRYLSKLTAAAL